MDIYDKKWVSGGYESAEEEARYKEYGKEILKKFWEIHAPVFRIPVATEYQFYLSIDGIRMTGYIDRVDKLDSGGLSIVDYKSSEGLFTGDYVDNNLQLTIYQMAAEQTWRLPVERLALYHLRTNTPCYTQPRSKKQTDEVRRMILEVAEKIERKEFPAIENPFCSNCDFPQYCPYYRHKYIRDDEKMNRQAMLPGIEAAEAVNRYAALQAQIKELEAELNQVKQQIIDYCQEQRLNRVFGEGCQITYRLVEKTGYDEDEVREILEPLGLWQKVLSFDQTVLKQLLEDGEIPAEAKEKILVLKRVTTSYPQLWLKHQAEQQEE